MKYVKNKCTKHFVIILLECIAMYIYWKTDEMEKRSWRKDSVIQYDIKVYENFDKFIFFYSGDIGINEVKLCPTKKK